jgi:hypothetical protein
MAIIGAGIKYGSSTFVVPSDGTATTLSSLGMKDGRTLQTFLAADTDILTRRSVDFTAKSAIVSPQAPNGFTQRRSQAVIFFPKVLANGKRTVNSLTIVYSCDVEIGTAEKQNQILLGSQVLGDSDFTSFWQDGAIG